MTYATLQEDVIDWSHRTDLAARIPRFIALAENEIFRELVVRAVETSVDGSTSGDTITLPTGLLAFERIKIEASGHEYTINYTSPNGVEGLTGSTNRPSRYLVEDGVIRLLSAPDGPYSYTIYFIPVFAPLSDAAPSNWLLENHLDVYLKAALLQVAKFTKDPDDMMRLPQEVGAAIDSIKRADERKRFPIAGGLQIKPRSYR